MNKHIILTNKGFNTLKTQQNAIYIALQYIELQCIALQSLALLSLRLQCILVLPIELQCITLQGIQAGVRKDPKNCAFVRTRLLTDFIDFLDLKSVFKSGTLKAFRFNYERFNDEKSDIRTKARGDEL
jgi:hypothetical protein